MSDGKMIAMCFWVSILYLAYTYGWLWPLLKILVFLGFVFFLISLWLLYVFCRCLDDCINCRHRPRRRAGPCEEFCNKMR